IAAGTADLFEIAQRLLLDGGEAARDVALGRLRLGEIIDLVRLDHVVFVGEPRAIPLLAGLGARSARLWKMFGAGGLRGLAEHAVDPLRYELVVHVADGRAGGEAGGGIGLAALGGDPQVGDGALLARKLRGPLQVVLGDARGLGDGAEVARAFYAESRDRFSGRRDAVDHALGPTVLDADDHHGRHVGVCAGPGRRAEERVEVFAELQSAIGVRQLHGALDFVGHRLARRIGKVVEWQDDHVIALPDAAVLAPPAEEAVVLSVLCD